MMKAFACLMRERESENNRAKLFFLINVVQLQLSKAL